MHSSQMQARDVPPGGLDTSVATSDRSYGRTSISRAGHSEGSLAIVNVILSSVKESTDFPIGEPFNPRNTFAPRFQRQLDS